MLILGSVGSGALACFASVLGKVAFDGDTPVHVMATTSCEEHLPGLALCNAVRVRGGGVRSATNDTSINQSEKIS